MIAIFTHTLTPSYGGVAGVGSFLRNLLAGFDQINCPYRCVPTVGEKPGYIRSRFVREQIDSLKLSDCEVALFPNYYLPPFGSGGRNNMVTVHDTLFLDVPGSLGLTKSLWVRFCLGVLLRRATAVNFISEFSRNRYFEHFGKAEHILTSVIPNSIDESVFTFRVERRQSHMPRVVTVSAFYPHKNLETFIKLAAVYRGKVEFIAIGRPPSNAEWERLVSCSPGLAAQPENVRFTGYIQTPEMVDILRGSDIFLFPSTYEGFGMPPVEAVALGLPVLCSDLPPLRESLDGRATFVGRPRDVDEWVAKLDRILSIAPDIGTRLEWSDHVRSTYGRAAIARKYANVLLR
jgi:glycosyltransferase involved in cell wall biosynthesis